MRMGKTRAAGSALPAALYPAHRVRQSPLGPLWRSPVSSSPAQCPRHRRCPHSAPPADIPRSQRRVAMRRNILRPTSMTSTRLGLNDVHIGDQVNVNQHILRERIDTSRPRPVSDNFKLRSIHVNHFKHRAESTGISLHVYVQTASSCSAALPLTTRHKLHGRSMRCQ